MKIKSIVFLLIALVLYGNVSVVFAAAGGSIDASPDPALVRELQERMLRDEGIMALIQALQHDPEMQAILADPKMLEAAQAGDISALLNDPRVMKLLNNPQVREIGKRLGNRGAGGER